jgi:two-component system alkaline phosphatase synthesis response regulator PhoP
MTKETILIIDDELDLVILLKMRLEHLGYQVFYLRSGKNALETVKNKKPDLIILDIMMPDRDGCDICYELKHNPDTASIPVIIFTAHSEWKKDMGDVSKFIKADDYVPKPFEPEVLLEKIRKLLKK